MHASRTFRVVESASAALRLEAATAFLLDRSPFESVTIVGATRGAADDLARRVAVARPATFGLVRLSLTQLAARTAVPPLAGEGSAPTSWLGSEAVATRAAFEAGRDAALHYFAPVAGTPGFPRALARTLQELRLTGIDPAVLDTLPGGGPDLSDLLARFESSFEAAGAVDRAALLHTAAALLRVRPLPGAVVLLDVPMDHPAERMLVEAAAEGAPAVLATAPKGDRRAVTALLEMGGRIERPVDDRHDSLASLREFLFETDAQPPERVRDDSLEFFSAPGEGRECVEIARRILSEARAGVRFDEMAILIRSPHSYFGLLEHALHRAGVPAWFDRGTRRPHPAGRAFLALLACASEQLSASRFAEYLSLGQVPSLDAPASPAWSPSFDEALGRMPEITVDEQAVEEQAAAAETANPDEAVVAGTLRAPWRWEELLGEAAVIGQDAARWRRRLEGRAREVERQLAEAGRDDGTGRARALELTLQQIRHLQRFALPMVETLAAWPARAAWGEWIEAFERLAPRVLRTPAYVLRVLADLRPMAAVGPIDLAEARRVLSDRLLMLESEPPSRRFGRVFVGTPQQARGRSFRTVFVPGLAERLFPQKPREDPLLLDDPRGALDPSLATQHQRLIAERLLLQLAVGAASERLHVSYPRIELTESRARVPSFYALDLMRAATGRLPDHESLEERARQAGNASLAWPAPADPDDAIDDQEHDLAVLRRLLDAHDRDAVKGSAHYLLSLNECLRRSVIDRWARGHHRWSPSDGLIRVTPRTAPALAEERLTRRSFSLSSLQRFSACPYQFVLSAVYRLQPLEQPQPLQRMDPLTRGSLFHLVQARLLRALDSQGGLPVTSANLAAASATLGETFQQVVLEAYDELAPAVERVWNDELASIRRDLDQWLRCLADEGEEWVPKYFEFAFGPVPGERDPRSVDTEAVLPGGFRLRGAIDLVEEHRQTKVLRVTDHKTGRRPDRIEKVIIGGGAVLQPVLYAMAAEVSLNRPVSHGRLFYCTSAGGFHPHPIPLNERTRDAALEVLQVIDRAVAAGFLAAAPTDEACGRCDYRPVCGPDVYRRVNRKPQDALADLSELRSRP
jgi:CRISPR/Cas system-associated exonuclease Cas4 (RecB family)